MAAAQSGFHSLSLDDEIDTTLSVDGSLPDWLSGVLFRNGPGAFELGGSAVDHWFDGLAMLSRFGFDGERNRVMFCNRFLRTDAFAAAREGEFSGGFTTGKTFAERARADLPLALPFDFHGRFVPELSA